MIKTKSAPASTRRTKVLLQEKSISITKNRISEEEFRKQVELKAYELFERRGFSHGNDVTDWLEAERLVKSGK